METIAQKQLAFLEETANHYNSNNRCTTDCGHCRYSPVSLGLNGKSEGCAIGRKLSPELALELDALLGGPIVTSKSVFQKLPLSLQELTAPFLRSVQVLHDQAENWGSEGLSLTGKNNVKRIKQRFEL